MEGIQDEIPSLFCPTNQCFKRIWEIDGDQIKDEPEN